MSLPDDCKKVITHSVWIYDDVARPWSKPAGKSGIGNFGIAMASSRGGPGFWYGENEGNITGHDPEKGPLPPKKAPEYSRPSKLPLNEEYNSR